MENLKTDEPVDVVFFGKASHQFLLVLHDALFEIVSDTRVENSRRARQDINEVALHVGVPTRILTAFAVCRTSIS
jgi:hypothetical protein